MAMSDSSAGQEISNMTGKQMSSCSDSSGRPIISKGRAMSEPIVVPQRHTPPEVNVHCPDEQPERSPRSSNPEYSSSNTNTFFFVLEEIQSTSSNPTIIRPATLRAVFLDKPTAQTAMDVLIYESRDLPAARRVICHDVFRDEQFLGEGYEYHTESLLWRTLWIQEGFQEEDMQVEESDDAGEEAAGEEDGTEGEEMPTVRIQEDGASLSGGGWSLPLMFRD